MVASFSFPSEEAAAAFASTKNVSAHANERYIVSQYGNGAWGVRFELHLRTGDYHQPLYLAEFAEDVPPPLVWHNAGYVSDGM